MKRYVQVLLIFVLGVFIILSLTLHSAVERTPQREFKDAFLDQFPFNKIESNGDTVRYEGTNDTLRIKVLQMKNINSLDAETYSKERITIIRSLYREMSSPYPGMVSESLRCEEGFIPTSHSLNKRTYYLLYATDRLAYGVCSWDLVTYRSVMFFEHCQESNTLYQFELFVPVTQDISYYFPRLDKIQCD